MASSMLLNSQRLFNIVEFVEAILEAVYEQATDIKNGSHDQEEVLSLHAHLLSLQRVNKTFLEAGKQVLCRHAFVNAASDHHNIEYIRYLDGQSTAQPSSLVQSMRLIIPERQIDYYSLGAALRSLSSPRSELFNDQSRLALADSWIAGLLGRLKNVHTLHLTAPRAEVASRLNQITRKAPTIKHLALDVRQYCGSVISPLQFIKDIVDISLSHTERDAFRAIETLIVTFPEPSPEGYRDRLILGQHQRPELARFFQLVGSNHHFGLRFWPWTLAFKMQIPARVTSLSLYEVQATSKDLQSTLATCFNRLYDLDLDHVFLRDGYWSTLIRLITNSLPMLSSVRVAELGYVERAGWKAYSPGNTSATLGPWCELDDSFGPMMTKRASDITAFEMLKRKPFDKIEIVPNSSPGDRTFTVGDNARH